MILSEIANNLSIINLVSTLSSYEEYNYSSTLKFLKLDDYVIHRVELLNNSYDETVLNTTLKLSGVAIGDLFYIRNQTFEISNLSDSLFYIFLAECDVSDLQLSDYTFKYDYLLVHKDFIDEFHLKFSDSAVVWGGFKISEDVNVINYYKKQIPFIEIGEELKELDLYAKDSIYRALEQKSAFERFLKLYHLLELEFDYSLIKKIKDLDVSTESNRIGTLLNDYSRTELDRLFELITTSCVDVNALAQKLNLIKPFQSLGEEMFINFGKGGKANYSLADVNKYNSLLADTDSFISSTSVKNFAKVNEVEYDKFIHYITAYWIYRIRCSIAHFKIGEYILTRDKEDFIVEFAEPLIKEVLLQFYKK